MITLVARAISGAWRKLKNWHTCKQAQMHAHAHKRGGGKFKWRNKGFILNYYYPFCKFWSFSFSRLLSSHKHFRMLESLTEKLRNIRDAYIYQRYEGYLCHGWLWIQESSQYWKTNIWNIHFQVLQMLMEW